jgi:hypothetical protein
MGLEPGKNDLNMMEVMSPVLRQESKFSLKGASLADSLNYIELIGKENLATQVAAGSFPAALWRSWKTRLVDSETKVDLGKNHISVQHALDVLCEKFSVSVVIGNSGMIIIPDEIILDMTKCQKVGSKTYVISGK